jgi:glycosyltransferase involved in cell wall biosynthesis
MTKRKKLLFLVTEDWYFCSHRLALAKAAQQAGFAVSVLTRVNKHGDVIQNADVDLIPLKMVRGGVNPLFEFAALRQIWLTYRQIKPDIVHHVALKPVLYGGLVALFMPDIKIVNLLAGLGSVFSSRTWTAYILRPLFKKLFQVLFKRTHSLTIVQNQEDYDFLSYDLQVPVTQLRLIKGSGVDTERFYPAQEPVGSVQMALVSRLLWDKGIGEYVAAVRQLKQKGLVFNAFLVGKPDAENMASIATEQLHAWQAEGVVQCLGYVEDVALFWNKTHIAVLPSYREGLPKSLLEAAAAGKPIVTTDTSGCKEIVEEGVNGFLVPVRTVKELANALEKLILDAALRKKMGAAGRKKVEQAFSNDFILAQTLSVYRELV